MEGEKYINEWTVLQSHGKNDATHSMPSLSQSRMESAQSTYYKREPFVL
jgi:hypothetical protein